MAPSGPIKTPEPNGGSFGITWEVLNQWDELVVGAAHEFGIPFGIPDLAPAVLAPVMKAMIAIESRGHMYDANGNVIERDDGLGDGLSVGLLQVKPKIWQWLVPDARVYTPEGNIRLGTAIMARAISQHGSWELALVKVFFPLPIDVGTDVTQSEYVMCVRGLLKEMGAPGATIPPQFVPFPMPRVFHVRPNVRATGRQGPNRGTAVVTEFGPGAAIACDGVFNGEVVEGAGHWLRTSGPQQLAIHAGAFVEEI